MNTARPKAEITGVGLLTSVADNWEEMREAIREGRSGLNPIETFDPTPFRTCFGGELKHFNPYSHFTAEEIERYSDPNLQYAIVAASRAISDARLPLEQFAENERFGLVVGTCNGGLRTAEDQYRIILGQMPGRFNREMEQLIRYHSVGKALTHRFGINGPTVVVATACSSSTGALAVALDLIEQGVVDAALVGGSDTMCLSNMAGFDAIRATSTGKTAPFSSPIGMNLGEGAAFFIMESDAHAKKRGIEPVGDVLGYALCGDAHHPTAPDPRGDGAYRTMSGALSRAGISIDDIGCINAHGTGTDANDRVESKAAAKLMGEREIPVYSFKSQVGHCMGAAGIIEAVAGLVAMHDDRVPATLNFREPRPGCTLFYVPNQPITKRYDRFISCNYAFGGNNAGIVIGKPDPDRKGREVREWETPVLTGGGVVSSLGLGVEVNATALMQGARGRSPIRERVRDRKITAETAGLVPPFNGRDVDRRVDFRSMNPLSRYATAAARLALGDAGIRISPREGLNTGVVNGVHVGPDEEVYMKAVVKSGGREADIGIFSQVVANATAGWVSNALQLKGYGTTVAQGGDAGLFALMVSALAIRGGGATRIVAGAADELYPQYLVNYHDLDYLHVGVSEAKYGLDFETENRRLVGEGAAYVVAESRSSAVGRGAEILGEIRGFGMRSDTDGFFEPCRDPAGLRAAAQSAMKDAGWGPEDVGMIVWTPKGNSTDRKTILAARQVLGDRADVIPFVTSVFHTGLMEAASGVATLAGMLHCWRQGMPLWPQLTGMNEFDERPMPVSPVNVLILVTSDLGFNLALAIAPEGGAS